ncbi:MAG TPA: hypothetical protein VF527_12065 [Pyrinomonadaceae bacterium]|jgi:hypothetical protein
MRTGNEAFLTRRRSVASLEHDHARALSLVRAGENGGALQRSLCLKVLGNMGEER